MQNVTAIGANAFAAQSNTVVIGSIAGVNSGSAVKVGIGTNTPQTELAVSGVITCKEVVVTLSGFPDYVFRPGYELMPLREVAHYIDANGHLPNVPSECEVEEHGVGLGDLNKILLEKVEELTLHMIEKDQQIGDMRRDLGILMARTQAALDNSTK